MARKQVGQLSQGHLEGGAGYRTAGNSERSLSLSELLGCGEQEAKTSVVSFLRPPLKGAVRLRGNLGEKEEDPCRPSPQCPPLPWGGLWSQLSGLLPTTPPLLVPAALLLPLPSSGLCKGPGSKRHTN